MLASGHASSHGGLSTHAGISVALNIAPATVAAHIRNILDKLGAHNRATP